MLIPVPGDDYEFEPNGKLAGMHIYKACLKETNKIH